MRYLAECPISFTLVVFGQRNTARKEHKTNAITTFRFGLRSAFEYCRRQTS
jgi:hypothetical protein